jgi:hypothetical protein
VESFSKYDYIFENILKPLRSKNARKIYTIFLEFSHVEYLTTFDIQKKLQGNSIKLSKKEINAWLISLKMAGLIIKEEARGKPSTLRYEEKYTFDKWRLTKNGLYLADDLDMLNINNKRDESLNTRASACYTPFIHTRATDYYKFILLSRFNEYEALISENEIAGYMLPTKNTMLQVLSECLAQNYIKKIITEPKGIFQRILALFGSVERSVYYKITEEGRRFIDPRKIL